MILVFTTAIFMFCVTTTSTKTISSSLPHDTALHSDESGKYELSQSNSVSIGSQNPTETQAKTSTQIQTQYIQELNKLRLRVLESDGSKASQHSTWSDGSKALQHSTWSDGSKASQHRTWSDGSKTSRGNTRSRVRAVETAGLQRDFEKGGQYTWQSDTEHIPGHKWLESTTSYRKEENESFSLPIDFFKCGGGHCSCFNSTSGDVYARCSDRGLQPMSKGTGPLFPSSLFSFVIANQHMKQISLERLLPFKNLRTVDASGNSVKHLSFARINRTLPLYTLDLSQSGISTIDCSYFSHIPNLKRLSLKQNILGSVEKCTFRTLHHLESLDLSFNRIRILKNGSFESLVNLQVLLLNNNHFSYLKQLTPTILQPLQRLRVLQIQGTKQPDSYLFPDRALSTLTRLRELSIDGVFGAKFGPSMKTLKQLNVLNFGFGQGGRCFTRRITSDFFANVPYLRSLNIGQCQKLESISTNAFDTIPHLKELGFSNVVYSLKRLLSELSGLRNSSLRKLTLSGVYNHTHVSLENLCYFLDKTDASNLIDMNGLQELDLTHNRLHVILHGFVAMLPKSLKHLNLSSNMLTSPTSLLIQGLSMTNLTSLDEANQLKIKGQSWGQDLVLNSRNQNKRGCPTSSKRQQKCPIRHGGKARESDDIKKDNVAQTEFRVDLDVKCRHEGKSDHSCASSELSGESSRFSKSRHADSGAYNHSRAEVPASKSPQFPPKLVMYTAYGSYSLGTTFFSKATKTGTLKLLNLSNTYFNNWGSNHLAPFIEIADLSINYCDTLHAHFLTPGNSLREVYLQWNILGNTFTKDDGSALRYFNNVTVINLSQNVIHYLSRQSLMGLISAQYIDLSKNRLPNFYVRLAHMTSLQVLDLSDNLLQWISPETRNDLDTIAHNHSIILHLYPNPLMCTCAGIELLHWMATTKVRILSKEYMFCYDENKRKQKVGDFSERVRQLQQSCSSKAYVIVLSIFSVGSAFLVIGAGVLFRYRWKFIYWKNVTLAKNYGFRGGGRGQGDNAPRFTFDAYILYSQEDRTFVLHECLNELETKRGHRLCVEDRDFMLGSYMPGAITSAVQSSSHTIPVITPAFLEEGDWCEYGLHMASMESLHSGRALLHPLVLLPVPNDDMPRDLLKSFQANHFSEYPPEEASEDVHQAFWDALSRALGHVEVVNGQMEDCSQR